MSFWRDVGLRVQLYVGKLLFMMRGVSAILYLVPSVTMSHVNVRMSVRCRRDGDVLAGCAAVSEWNVRRNVRVKFQVTVTSVATACDRCRADLEQE